MLVGRAFETGERGAARGVAGGAVSGDRRAVVAGLGLLGVVLAPSPAWPSPRSRTGLGFCVVAGCALGT